ncbi:hypothetical protein F0F44_08445 [Campylobacter coli]|nr:hypothetical protein [Campylobacter coli]
MKNDNILIENKEQYDYVTYKGEISNIRKSFLNNDIQFFVNFWNSKNKCKYFEIQHPLLNHITTRAVFSTQFGTANFIFMIDVDNQHPWIIGQCQSLVDSIIVGDKLYIISTVMQVDLFKQIHNLSKLNVSNLKFRDIEFGYILSQNRPFHHFYDQLRYFYFMKNPKPIFNNDSFFVPNHALKTSENLVYFFPSGICVGQISSRILYAKKNSIADMLDDNLEKKLLLDSLISRQYIDDKQYELNLWFTICSEKRYWLDQIHGYVNIIKEFLKYYTNIRVFLDGITSKEDFTIEYTQDYYIYERICLLLKDISKDKCIIQPLIGIDYKTKIYYGSKIDCFVAVSGTASIVPYRICKKYGLIISNSILYNLDNVEDKFLPDASMIIDQIEPKDAYFKNFHISWEYIFNTMVDILDNKNIVKIKQPSNEEVVLRYIANSCKELNRDKKWKDLILDLILVFERANYLDIAFLLANEFYSKVNHNQQKTSSDMIEKYREHSSYAKTISHLELQLQNKTNELKNLQENIAHKKQFLEVQNLEQDVNLKHLKAKEIQENINLKTLKKTKIQKELEQYSNNIVYVERYHQSAKQRIYNHLSYKLGFCAIKNSKTLLGWIVMPITLLGILIAHKQEQKIYQEKIQQNPSLKLPPLESYVDYQEAKKEENSFTYKLGQAIINANKTWYKGGYVRLIFEIRKLKEEIKCNDL